MCEAITALYAVCKTIQTPFNATQNVVLHTRKIEVFSSHMNMYRTSVRYKQMYDERVTTKMNGHNAVIHLSMDMVL